MRSTRVGSAFVLIALVTIPALASGTSVSRRGVTSSLQVHARERTTWDSVYNAEQADRGQEAYKQVCSRCHRDALSGGDEAPALTGSAFMSAWNGQTLEDLHERIRTSMPTDTPGVYSKQQVTDVIAYMLRFNGFPAGAHELTHELDALKGIKFVATKP